MMRTVNNLSTPFIICLMVSVSQAFDICTNNECKNGAQCLPQNNGLYKCQCINGYNGNKCEIKPNCYLNQCKNGATCIDMDNGYRCQCLNGWDGEYCQNNIDDCVSKPCQNGGFCKDLENHKYHCDCLPSFKGMRCEHKDPCAEANPCGVNGDCQSDNTGRYKCHCNKGFGGPDCSIDINECEEYSTGLCENGGKCINTVGSYRCECAKGYSGERCANDIVDCKNGTCKNGGTCLDKIGHYKCVCSENFKGDNCEIPIPICETRPCKNFGLCRDYGNDYFCNCPKPWKGTNCEERHDPCSENTCINGGICESDGMDNFKCICKPGYSGKLCEQNINECLGIHCHNKGICEDLNNSWRCKCSKGFLGRYCEINNNECESKPCKNNAQCIDLVDDYKCICPSGLEGKNCEINIDDCANHPCINGARCEDRVGGFTCHCITGFVGLRCELKSDVCAQLSPCKNGGTCRNDPNASGGYVCICLKEISNKDCSSKVTECAKLTCSNGGKCVDDGEERCICSPGFMGSRCEIDIDECRSNPCQHGGSCQDMVNDYTCYCPVGYHGKNCESNINECVNNPCSPNGVCIDEVNGHRCECFSPFIGPTCSLKLDPCMSNICSNDAICIPSKDYTSYHCNCSSAYGRFTGRYCEEDINECLLNKTAIMSYQLIKPDYTQSNVGPCLNMGKCINTKGSFICKCQSGFEGIQCERNIDDCANDPCKNGAICYDLINGYKCHCQLGFSGENCEIEINECKPNPCQNDGECKDHIDDYQCACKSGYSGKNCEINDDDCNEQSCSGHGKCIDKVNDYNCLCVNGYKGRYCEQLERPCDGNQCLNGGACFNRNTNDNEPGYLCNCRLGFSGPKCEVKIDLCKGNPCGDHGLCSLEERGFKCKCHKGYFGELCEIHQSETCQTHAIRKLINESTICSHGGFCFNQPELGGFKCSCPKGYKGTFCEVKNNYCANQPCLNGGECKDSFGMYSCKCLPGFQGVNCQVNWNDCSSEPCKFGKCIDQIDNFTCICPRGVSGRLCDVVKDNCKNVKCQNEGKCRNIIGDFDCQCKKGFTGKFCETDINECRYGLNGIILNKNKKPYGPCSPSGTSSCIDSRGDFICLCRPGFIGKYCQQRIDICEEKKKSGKLSCFNSGICVNQFDKRNSSKISYNCLCPAGYGGVRCQLYNKKCQLNLCLNGGICHPIEKGDKMSFVCDCPKGIGGLFCEKDYINECDSNLCYNGGQCFDGFGKAICRCPQNFCGDMCEISDGNTCNNTIIDTSLSYTEELSQCHRHLCNTKVNNKRCDLECNNLACGFDGGECLHKVPKSVDGKTVALATPWSNCTIIKINNIPCHHWFMNGRCDPQCNTEGCLFDGWDCEKVVNQCPNKEFCDDHYGDKQCQQMCNTLECDFDGGDCLQYDNTTISGAIVLVLPVSTTIFVNIWQTKLLQSLTHLLHSIVRVKKQESGNPMIYPIRVFVENVQEETSVRHKRSLMTEGSNGKPGTKVYLEVDNSACKSTNNMCFDNSKSAAEFVSAALHSRLYRPPIQILSVQADSERRLPILPVSPPLRNMLIYIILVMTCLIVLGILIGVLYGFMQNKSKSDKSKTKKAETWFPEGMKRFNQSSSSYHHRRLSSTNRKRNQNALNGINFNSELGNLPQMTKSKISTTDSIDDSGSNSLTSTRVTSYDININENNNDTNNTSENCMLLSNGDITCNFPPEKRLKLHMDSNKCSSDHPNLEVWCFNAFVHLLVSGNGLGEVNSSDGRDKQIVMEKIFEIALNHSNHDNPNMFSDIPNKKELTNSSLTAIITSRLSYSGETLLHLAAKFNRKDAVRFLVEAGSDPNKEENSGRTCLLLAIDSGALEVVSYFLEQRHFTIDIHYKGPGGATGLIQAVKGAHIEIIHILLQHTQPEECDLNVTDEYGRTALHWASTTNQIVVVQLLLSYGLNRDAQDNEEMTPLYLASREGSYEVCKLLIANGANPDMSDHLDRLPRDIAKANHFDDIVDLLDDYINLSKENQQNRPMMWGQYSYYSNNYYCPSHHMDLKSVLYSSPHSLNQMSCCVFPNTITNEPERSAFYNTPLATAAHSNHPCYRANSTNYATNVNNPLKKHVSLHTTAELTNTEVKFGKHEKSAKYYKDSRNYFEYCATPNVHMMSNIKNFVVTNNAMLTTGAYHSNNNPTSSTSAPGITPSPDSDSPGHWSTSSPSLSPRSKNQQHLTKQLSQKLPVIQQIKPSVLHYHPTNDSGDLSSHTSNLQTNELYGFHSRNNLCQY